MILSNFKAGPAIQPAGSPPLPGGVLQKRFPPQHALHQSARGTYWFHWRSKHLPAPCSRYNIAVSRPAEIFFALILTFSLSKNIDLDFEPVYNIDWDLELSKDIGSDFNTIFQPV